jgi:hypothetical protein
MPRRRRPSARFAREGSRAGELRAVQAVGAAGEQEPVAGLLPGMDSVGKAGQEQLAGEAVRRAVIDSTYIEQFRVAERSLTC